VSDLSGLAGLSETECKAVGMKVIEIKRLQAKIVALGLGAAAKPTISTAPPAAPASAGGGSDKLATFLRDASLSAYEGAHPPEYI
jgi:hypothetical protein